LSITSSRPLSFLHSFPTRRSSDLNFLELVVLRIRFRDQDRQGQGQSDCKSDYFHFDYLCLRLDGESDSWFGVTGNRRLILQISTSFVKRRNNCERNCRSEHNPNEEHEVAGSLQLHGAVRVLDEKVDCGGELVAERHGEEIRAHDKRFEF